MEDKYLFIKVGILGNILSSQEDSEFIKRLLSFGGGVKFYSYESIKKYFGYRTRSGVFKRINKLVKNGVLIHLLDIDWDGSTYHELKLKGLVDG